MVSARPLVNKGLIKRVGSGNSISVWEDPWIPASRPRPATGHGANFYPHLWVSELMTPGTSTWNLPLLHQLFDSEDVPIILGIPTSSTTRPDSMGWFFTKSGTYTVKSGYILAQQSLDEANPIKYGPDISPLQAYTWKVKWARLRSRGIQIDPQCVRCGMAPETVNHMLFECPPALQVWALSPIPTALDHFPTGDPNDIINHAASEAVACRTAQEKQEVTPALVGDPAELSVKGEICQIDGSWKATDPRAGLGWYNFNTETGEKLMGTCNLRRGISPLQAKLEALVWAMQCMLRQKKLTIVFQTDCSDVVKMVSKPEEWQLLQQD
ncbi:unnamed protein product [Microthlaspi erraticum]|uniref:RNase H type-1 domain-containing protein n=1 Tax=Microthlaspi erraticum TaxID=1685480 RepID=A0A6D2HTV9_9BRAS|nr:unnamed protein product [Microthlaspi erraticum]